MACTIIRNKKVMRKRKQWVKKRYTTVFHAAFLTHSLQFGGFQSCTCADGHWLVGENSGCLFLRIEKKKIPNEWLSTSTFRAVVPLSRVLCSTFLGHLAISPPCLHYSGYNSMLAYLGESPTKLKGTEFQRDLCRSSTVHG